MILPLDPYQTSSRGVILGLDVMPPGEGRGDRAGISGPALATLRPATSSSSIVNIRSAVDAFEFRPSARIVSTPGPLGLEDFLLARDDVDIGSPSESISKAPIFARRLTESILVCLSRVFDAIKSGYFASRSISARPLRTNGR